MRAIFATLALAASLAGCANLTAQQQEIGRAHV